jgi:hypothetical protein
MATSWDNRPLSAATAARALRHFSFDMFLAMDRLQWWVNAPLGLGLA